MRSAMTPVASMTVTIDEVGQMWMLREWDERQLPALIWALQVAHSAMLKTLENQLFSRPTADGTPIWNQHTTKKVSKNEAFNYYLEIWKKIQERIKAINDSDDRASFQINANLPKEL